MLKYSKYKGLSITASLIVFSSVKLIFRWASLHSIILISVQRKCSNGVSTWAGDGWQWRCWFCNGVVHCSLCEDVRQRSWPVVVADNSPRSASWRRRFSCAMNRTGECVHPAINYPSDGGAQHSHIIHRPPLTRSAGARAYCFIRHKLTCACVSLISLCEFSWSDNSVISTDSISKLVHAREFRIIWFSIAKAQYTPPTPTTRHKTVEMSRVGVGGEYWA